MIGEQKVFAGFFAWAISVFSLDQRHVHYRLADKINWVTFEQSFSALYSPDNGRPARSVRLMCGLLILKYLRNLSDESVVEQWSENACYQYFCGCLEFTPF